MQQRFLARASVRSTGATAVSAVLLASLTACGGGGGDSTPATVSTMNVSVTKYGVAGLITVTGTHLGNLQIQAPGCRKVARLTAAPTASTDTTSYYSCTPSGAYSSTITAVTNGTTLTSQTFTVLPPIVTMTVSNTSGTVNGSIVFNLKGNVAPITVDNFLDYVNAGFYNGLIFHRVAHYNNPLVGPEYFVVQGGNYGAVTSGTLPAAPKTPLYSPIKLETTGGGNIQWTAAMANTGDPNSATSGFFFNVINDTAAFDTSSGPRYAVFADVSSSAAVITQITQATCTSLSPSGFNDGSCIPIPNVNITTAMQTQ
jgi:cyclophilin family peptidyl-prolyl cis-trans isomerase